MSKKKESREDEVTLADPIIGETLKNKPSRTLVPEPAAVVTEDGVAYQADKKSTPHLIAKQQRDPTVCLRESLMKVKSHRTPHASLQRTEC